MRVQYSLCMALLLLSVGCTSARSILLHRGEHNLAWERERHLPGIPITLKVPTHLKVAIVEKHYLVVRQDGTVSRAAVDVPLRQVRHDFIMTDRIFTVDFKRPAAGTMNLTLEMEEQYFKKIQHQVVDETIQDIAALIGTIAPGGLFTPASEDITTGGLILKEVENVIAVRMFEIEAPDFEQQLTAFLDCHINQAHDAWVVPPGVDRIRRLPLTVLPYETNLPPLCQQPGCETLQGGIPAVMHGSEGAPPTGPRVIFEDIVPAPPALGAETYGQEEVFPPSR